jgi:hypothetical protein
MSYKVYSLETLKEAKRKQTIEEKVPYIEPGGKENFVTKKIVNGEMEVLELARPIGEMITTASGLAAVVQKTVIDLELGREQVPLLYKPIYRAVENRNFTRHVDIRPFIGARVVFLEHMELEEVKMGDMYVGPTSTVPIVTYAAGFEWTEDTVMYSEDWSMTELSRAMGEAYNALLNHIHLYPILSYDYPAKNKTAASTEGATYIEKLRNTIKQGLIDAASDRNTETRMVRKPTVLLAHPSKQWDIEEALQRMQIGGTIYNPITQINSLVFYDGYSIQVGEKTYEYPGVAPNKAYLIDPQKYFVELIKHDLIIDAAGADLKRLIEGSIVGRARRGVVAAPENAVQEITLP